MQKYILITDVIPIIKNCVKRSLTYFLDYSCKLCDIITFPRQFPHKKVNLHFYLVCTTDNFSLTRILQEKKIKYKNVYTKLMYCSILYKSTCYFIVPVSWHFHPSLSILLHYFPISRNFSHWHCLNPLSYFLLLLRKIQDSISQLRLAK